MRCRVTRCLIWISAVCQNFDITIALSMTRVKHEIKSLYILFIARRIRMHSTSEERIKNTQTDKWRKNKEIERKRKKGGCRKDQLTKQCYEWMNGWVSEWMNEWMNEFVNEADYFMHDMFLFQFCPKQNNYQVCRRHSSKVTIKFNIYCFDPCDFDLTLI